MNSIDCHVCGCAVSVTPRGRMRSHKRWGMMGRRVTCQGSGLRPGEALIPLAPEPAPAPAPAAPATVAYRCKVSPGRVIELVLPVDLSADEMRRLCAFLMTQADEPAACASNEHPDGCHTEEPGTRDCESDGHYSCRTCSRRVEEDGGPRTPHLVHVKPVTGPWPAGPWPSDDEERARQRGGA